MNFESLEETVKACLAVPDWEWERLSLSQDMMFRYFSSEQVQEIIRISGDCGRQEAKLLKEQGMSEPFLAAKEFGIETELCEEERFRNPRVVNYAQYSKGRILISAFMAEEIGEAVHSLPEEETFAAAFEGLDAAAVLAGHELFHHIQENKPELAVNTMRVPITQLRRIKRNITPPLASEIAAFAFVKELMDLRFYPRMVEILGLWRTQRAMALRLAKKLCGEVNV